MKTLRYMALVIGMLASVAVFANQSTGSVSITSLTNWVGTANNPNEALLVQTNSQAINPAICAVATYYYLDAASAISRSMLLAAYAAGTNVDLVISDGGCSSGGYPLIVAVTLIK